MPERPKRLRLFIDGKEDVIEIDEETTAILYRTADAEGVAPEIYFKSLLNSRYVLHKLGLLKREER